MRCDLEISVAPSRAGRLSPRLRYRAGLDRPGTSYWVEPKYEGGLQQLVDAVVRAREHG